MRQPILRFGPSDLTSAIPSFLGYCLIRKQRRKTGESSRSKNGLKIARSLMTFCSCKFAIGGALVRRLRSWLRWPRVSRRVCLAANKQGVSMLRYLLLGALVFELSGTVSAAELKPATVAAFDHYVQLSEQRMTTEMPGTFLLIDSLP